MTRATGDSGMAGSVRPKHSPSGVKYSGSCAGFTLVELVVVLALLAALLGTTVIALSWTLPRWRLREAGNSVASYLREARTTAIVEHVESSVLLDITSRRYALATQIDDKMTGIRNYQTLPPRVQFARPEAGDVVTVSPLGSTDYAAVFSSKGLLLSSDVPGYIYLGDTRRDVYLRVSVSWVGAVKVKRWNGATWQ